MSGAPHLRSDPLASSRSKRLTKRERERLDLLRGFGLWLGNQGYQVGLTPESIPPSGMVSLAKALAPVVGTLVHLGPAGPALQACITGGADADEIARRLDPIKDIVDLVGVRGEAQAVMATAVIFADELEADRLLARFELLVDFSERLKDLGTFRIPILWSPNITLDVVYVFFEAEQCERKIDALLQDGRRDASGRWIRASCLDLESEMHHAAAAQGGWAVREMFENEDCWFGAEDVPLVLELAQAARERET